MRASSGVSVRTIVSASFMHASSAATKLPGAPSGHPRCATASPPGSLLVQSSTSSISVRGEWSTLPHETLVDDAEEPTGTLTAPDLLATAHKFQEMICIPQSSKSRSRPPHAARQPTPASLPGSPCGIASLKHSSDWAHVGTAERRHVVRPVS